MVQVDFEVTRVGDIPKIGSRRRVRLTGRAQILYVRSVDVRAYRDYDEAGHQHWTYEGSVTLSRYDDLYR